MAENFFTGLTGAIQQNAKQRNNDDYIELMRQKQLQSEMSGALADKRAAAADLRADEELGLRREAANRQQEESTRRIRALDFEQSQREEAAQRAKKYTEESSQFATKYWAPEAVLDAAGNPVLDAAGNPVTTKRDPKNFRDQFKFWEGIAAIGHKHNGVDPKAYGQFLIDRRTLEEAGKTQVFENALRQEKDALTEVGAAIGLTGDVRIVPKKDSAGLPVFVFTGKGKDGKPTEVEALTAMSIFGGNARDPAAGVRAQAVQGEDLKIKRADSDSRRISATASMVSASRRGGGGDGGAESDESVPLSGKALAAQADKLADNIARDKPSFSGAFGMAPLDTPDEFARDRQREIGDDLLRRGVPNGKGGRIYPQTAVQAQTMASDLYSKVERNVVGGINFAKNKEGKYAQVPAGTPGAVPFNHPGVPFQLRQRARDEGVRARLSGKQ